MVQDGVRRCEMVQDDVRWCELMRINRKLPFESLRIISKQDHENKIKVEGQDK